MNNNQIRQVLARIGVQKPEQINDEKLPDVLDQIRDHFRQTTIDPRAQIAQMCALNPGELGYVHPTLLEFQLQPKGFLIAEATSDFSIPSALGGIPVKRGQLWCMTSDYFTAFQKSGPKFKPSGYYFGDLYKPYNGQDLNNKKLFVWRTGGIGDLLFIRPLLVELKKRYPTSTILLATRSDYNQMITQWDDCLDLSTDVPFTVHNTLQASDYHLTFEGLIERCKEAETRDVHDLFANHAGMDPDSIEWECGLPSQPTETWAKAGLTPGKYVVMQKRASSPVRTPYQGTFLRIANQITAAGYKVLLSDSPSQRRTLREFITCCDEPSMIVNGAEHTTGLNDMLEAIRHSAFVVAPDSSHVHAAAMMGVRSLSLYGPFPAAARTTRYMRNISIEPNPSEVCKHGGRGCFLHAPKQCEHYGECWDHLSDDEIEKILTSWLT